MTHRLTVTAAGVVLLLVLALSGAATARASIWVRNNSGHRVGSITGGLNVRNASGAMVGTLDHAGTNETIGIVYRWNGSTSSSPVALNLALKSRLYTYDGKTLRGLAAYRSGRWVVYKRVSGTWRRRGTVENGLPACHALSALRLLLWR